MVVERFDVWLTRLNPTEGHGIRKTRPALVISPDEMNRHLETIIIAPMTTKGREYPTRIPIHFQGKTGQVVLDQIRSMDKKRLIKKLGRLDDVSSRKTLSILEKLFAP